MAIVLGFDIGTTSTIGILVDTEGAILALADRSVDLYAPRPGWAEEDPEQWWSNVCDLIPALLNDAGIEAGMIEAVGVSGMVPALVMLDDDGRPVRRSIQQSDGRTGREVEAIRQETDENRFLQRAGNGINQQLIAPKLRWLRQHEPEAVAQTHRILGSYDFIARRLTGADAVEKNWALEAGFFDLEQGRVAEDLIALGKIEPTLVPSVREGHEIIGSVSAKAAEATGLKAGTPVVAGAADHVASAFVAGVAEPGDFLIKFGGAGDVLLATAEPKPDSRLFLDFHTVPGLFMPNGCMVTSGSLLNWFIKTMGAGAAADAAAQGKSPHAHLDRSAANTSAGAEGLVLLPYFLGEKTPIQDPIARGTFIGLGLHHDTHHLWRAVLESVCMGFRHHVEVARQIGYPVTRIIASDGGTKSPLWMQIAASSLGMPVQLLEGHPGSCLGAAYVAAMGIGAFPDWQQMTRFVQSAGIIEPETLDIPIYDEVYGVYRQTYEALKPIYPKLQAFGG